MVFDNSCCTTLHLTIQFSNLTSLTYQQGALIKMFAYPHRRLNQESQANAENLEVASAFHECQSRNAKQLWILDPVQKFIHSSTYEICGTYTDKKPEVWFYLASSVCAGGNYLLNLFFVHRQVGNIVIGVSDSNVLDKPVNGKMSLPNTLQYFSFNSTKPNENHFIKTYNLPSMKLLLKESPNFVDILVIPISISTKSKAPANTDITNFIKFNHFNEFFNKMGQTDYTLETLNKKQYKVHKLILALQSPILRDVISSQPACATLDINDEDMELLLELLYGGISKSLNEHDSKRLFKMVRHFKLNTTSSLVEVIGKTQEVRKKT